MRILDKSDPVELAGRAIAQISEALAIIGFLAMAALYAGLKAGVL